MGVLEAGLDELKAIHDELKAIRAALAATPPPAQPPVVIPPSADAGATVVNLMLHAAVDVPANSSVIDARFATAGEYYLWVYGVFPSVSADSFFVSLNGEPDTIFDAAENRQGPNAQWSALNKRGAAGVDQTPRKLVFVAGENSIKIRPREPGATIQRVFLTHGTQLPAGATLPTVPPPVPPIAPPSVEVPTEGDVYVAPFATSSGSGTKDSPWTIDKAFMARVAPGKHVWLLGGEYNLASLQGKGATCKLQSTASSRIVVSSAPGEWATLRGLLYCRAQYTDFRDFEIVGLDSNRRSSIAQSWTPNDLLGGGLDCQSDDSETIVVGKNRFINLLIHDCNNNGVGFWRTQPGNELHDCLIYHNGWLAPDRAHGHGIYTQNLQAQGEFIFKNCFVFRNFVYGVQAYGQGDFVNGYRVDGCAFWGSGEPSKAAAGGLQPSVILGAGHPAKGIRFNNNFSHGFASVHFGYQGNPGVKHADLEMINNHLHGGIELTNWTTITGAMNYASNNPAYLNSASAKIPGLTIGAPVDTEVYVRASEFANRANVVIFNPRGLGNVVAPVPILARDQRYKVRDVQNIFGPSFTGTYDGMVTFPMAGLSAVQPIGAGLTKIEHTGPKFGAFIVEAV